jgi:thioredoxin 1
VKRDSSDSDSVTRIARATDETFSEMISRLDTVIVYFWADMPVARDLMDPVMDELVARYGDAIRFVKLDINQSPVTAVSHDILSIPTLVVFEHGAEVSRLVGTRSVDRLESDLGEYLTG